MAVEAASTGKPVLVRALQGSSPKHEALHRALQTHGATRPFDPTLDAWSYEPLRETERAAAEVLRRLSLAAHGARG